MSSFRRSVLFSAADRYVSQALFVLTTAIMARILTPAETGVFIIAQSLVLVLENLRAFGLGPYIVQSRTLDTLVVRSAFTFTLVFSVGLAALIYATADPVAVFYGDPALADLLRVAAIAFFIAPFSSPIIALLQREFAFQKLAVINVLAMVANAGTTIGLGVAGFGPVSFVWGSVAMTTVTALLAFATRPEAAIYRPSVARLREFASFGSISSFVVFINFAADMLPRLVFGKLLGFDAVGLYGRAVTICQLPDRAVVQALQPVVLPAMAAHAREGKGLREAWLRGHTLMSAVQWPTLVMIALLAEPVVRVLLGAQWIEAAPIVRMIAFATMALAPAFMTYPVLVSAGRVRDTLWSSLVSLPPSVAILILAADRGLDAVAAAMLIVAPFQMCVCFAYVRRAIGVTWKDLLKASRGSAALALGTALVPTLVLLVASPDGFSLGIAPTLIAIAGGALGWIATLILARHPIGEEIAIVWRHLESRLPLGLRRSGRQLWSR
jgi:O-antigen/teichoic acid export membrane protein